MGYTYTKKKMYLFSIWNSDLILYFQLLTLATLPAGIIMPQSWGSFAGPSGSESASGPTWLWVLAVSGPRSLQGPASSRGRITFQKAKVEASGPLEAQPQKLHSVIPPRPMLLGEASLTAKASLKRQGNKTPGGRTFTVTLWKDGLQWGPEGSVLSFL